MIIFVSTQKGEIKMTIEVMKYGDGKLTSIECKSFEFRTNQVSNWIKVRHFDDREELIREVCVIKCKEDMPRMRV